MSSLKKKYLIMNHIPFLILALMSTRQAAFAQSEPPRQPYPYPEIVNWTSCEEFVNNTVFDPGSVLDIDWKIFYFWNPEIEQSYNIKFSRPSSVLVDRFRVELDEDLKPPANWSDAELFMETTIDFSALYLKTSFPGIYRVIPSTAFDYNSVPLLIFGMKLAESGYLGIANCKHRICYALAPADKMPFHYELEKAASTLKFYNNFNRSHIWFPHPSSTDIPYAPGVDLPDDDQDDDLEVEQDPSRLEFF